LSDNKGTILDWFRVRRESVIMKGVRDHSQKIGDTVSELNRADARPVRQRQGRALDAIKRLIYSEKEADQSGGDGSPRSSPRATWRPRSGRT